MPAREPFTLLCQAVARSAEAARADLHVHSTASDGRYTPAQIVDVARRSGLAAVALTDHDTMAGYRTARDAAGGRVEVIPAVELSAVNSGREVHLLGYFVRPDDPGLTAALARLNTDRIGRFDDMLTRLRDCGVTVPDDVIPRDTALGRRHLAEALVAAGRVGTVREAFDRYLDAGKPAFVPHPGLDIAEAIRLVRAAGGVSSFAHPPGGLDFVQLRQLRAMGLDAVEAVYPTFKASRTVELREWAARLDMHVTGGSDCHGPDEARRPIGCRSVSADELNLLRQRAAERK